jgi:hypothetical protein
MSQTGLAVLASLCALGFLSLLVVVLVYKPFPWIKLVLQSGQPRPLAERHTEKLIKQYLKKEQLQHSCFMFNDRQITLIMLLNQTEREFARVNLKKKQLQERLDAALGETLLQRPNLECLTALAKHSPSEYSQLFCITLAGYAVARASLNLIGADQYHRMVHPKIFKKMTSGGIGEPRPNLNILKAANPLPWFMIEHAFDYWQMNRTFLNHVYLQTLVTSEGDPFRTIITTGYSVGLKSNFIDQLTCLAA